MVRSIVTDMLPGDPARQEKSNQGKRYQFRSPSPPSPPPAAADGSVLVGLGYLGYRSQLVLATLANNRVLALAASSSLRTVPMHAVYSPQHSKQSIVGRQWTDDEHK